MSTPSFEPKDLTVTVSLRRRTLEMYPMLRQELDTLVSGYSSVYLALFGIAFGTFVTVLIAVTTVVLSDRTLRVCWDAVLITGLFSVLFGALAARDLWKSRDLISKLRKETADVEVRVSESASK